ncbi:MAG TPA: hypothetical protein PK079_07830 [Leptospiraceae bacterium]|nr:hypothetical protein [Leptospiraceae bacterium]HMW07405.1 hypothetical protein [Leptospiraceae bacterium]HMX35274.1 hypothetical protein [Leptospiraceae bacterium]HMY32468.1 hypothetical protein [Leptospiraceae bacterium]HMZ66873.1 hypothetical protein [Leptospiraceae bacterium]
MFIFQESFYLFSGKESFSTPSQKESRGKEKLISRISNNFRNRMIILQNQINSKHYSL